VRKTQQGRTSAVQLVAKVQYVFKNNNLYDFFVLNSPAAAGHTRDSKARDVSRKQHIFDRDSGLNHLITARISGGTPMFQTSQLSRAVRTALGVGVSSLAFSATPQAMADEGETSLEEIVVTGSRLAVDANLASSSPVTTIKAEEFSMRGITRAEDLVNSMPSVVPELTANESNGATGTATLDLRGLGSDRTLVLVNGHRMGFGDPIALAPDINQIPSSLVDRVELLTGGASSVYGADAVAGVVNFIMKSDFEGFQFDIQRSAYQHKNGRDAVSSAIDDAGFAHAPSSTNDGGTTNINLTFGVNTADGSGNLTAYLGFRDIDAILQSEREFSACSLSSSNGTTCAGSATLPTGLITPFDGTYFTVAGDQFVPWDYTYYNYGPLNYFQRPDERITGGLFGHIELPSGAEAYTEMMFMDDHSLAQIAPSGAFFDTSTLACDNVFFSAQQYNALGCTDPSDIVPFYVGRRNVEGGPRIDDLRHTSMRSLIGLRGDIGDNWSFDVSANFSRLRFSEVFQNDLSITRIARALDAVDDGNGNAVCRSALNGVDPSCVPWNVFQTGGVTQAAIDYLRLPLHSKGDLTQDQYVAFIAGDLTDSVKLPTATDGVQVLVGIEQRNDNFDYQPDSGYQSGDGSGQGGSTTAVSGAVDVTELFTEVKIPLVQDRPGIQSLSLDLRYRNSDYDTGTNTDTFNYGGEYTPVESLKIRGGFSRAVRAPNIRELFEPQGGGLWSGTDPCAGATPELSAAECANSGVTAAQYGSIPASPAGQYNAIFGGNPLLIPETSDSITVGAVFTPKTFLDGLTVSVDYWNIEVSDAISSGIGEEFSIRQCGATGDPTFCSLISRGPNGNLWVGDAAVQSTNVNIGFFEVEGIDISATYALEIGNYGGLNFAFRGTVVNKFQQQPTPGATVEECAGFWGGSCGRPRPEWKHTLNTSWSTPWDATVTLGWRRVGDVREFALDRYTASAQDYFDLSGVYTANWFGEQTEITFGINNIADNDPPVSGLLNNIAVYGNGNTVPGSWDTLGRYWFVGLSQSF
jgi:iron complex outermembrane recepter protein